MTEPTRRADGRCACGCGKRLKRPRTPLVRKVLTELGRDPYERDPFASRECCERFYGIDRHGHALAFELDVSD